MAKAYTVQATWDADAGVFTTQSDILGLVVEAETFEDVVELVRAPAPGVIAANAPDPPAPYKIEIVTRREFAFA